ncbi:MFS transporter [Microbulbifer bruguierae]|uniref:MFS transporter n=1 Tax=Microbulbifer bruguierae TaxID=3029061 RepID=A0ABY8NGI3_9GAMM|nr:MFS transporter [Microbulbifer bruguierae]WGL16832.1 MFS transporter [Microbulbifer bruguierae]
MKIAFFVVLLDMIGFGIMLPILAYYALQLGADASTATFCMALYVFGMFIGTPVWGRLSDRFGRKPILAISLVGSVLGYIVLAFATEVWMVGVSRLFSGLMAGNLSVAQAYVADVTDEKDRAKGMGMLGAAFGLSFILGPLLGGVLAGDSFEDANLRLPAMISALLSASALLCVLLFLRESRPEPDTAANDAVTNEAVGNDAVGNESAAATNSYGDFLRWLFSSQPLLLLLFIAMAVYNVAAGLVESVFPIWAEATGIADGPQGLVPILLVAGLAMVVMQGGAIGPLSRRFGEARLVVTGSVVFGLAVLGLTLAGSASSSVGATGALVVQAIGAALVITSMQSLVSKQALANNRGAVMGSYSALGTLGRGIGTAVTGALFSGVHLHASYYLGALCMIPLLAIALWVVRAQLATGARVTGSVTDKGLNVDHSTSV